MTILEHILNFIKDVFPVSFITIVLVGLGYVMARITRRNRIKVYETIIGLINKG